MTDRQIIQLAGTVTDPSAPQLDVTPDEISIANLSGLAMWAASDYWGVNSLNTGFIDRVTDKPHLANGGTTVKSRLIGSSYQLADVNQCIVAGSDVNTSGSFSVALSVGVASGSNLDAVRVGNFSSGVFWVLASEFGTGKLRFIFNGAETTYAAYSGPALVAGGNHLRVVLVFNVVTNVGSIYVNGALAATTTNALIAAGLVAGGCIFGSFNNSETFAFSAGMRIRSPMVFNRALELADISLIDRHLYNTKY
jgi:hypothetical protein